MNLALLRAFALAALLCGCASTPTLRSPDDVANSIGGNAVAYNQAYGRAIADQVLLNVLRARDRLPLYYLSMSGITDDSTIANQRTAGIGSITLGGEGSPWGVGALGGQTTTTISPGYSLNPFSSGKDESHARQFQPVSGSVFQHFWQNSWPREILLYVMVSRIDVGEQHWSNSSSNYYVGCDARADGETQPLFEQRCGFAMRARELANIVDPAFVACAPADVTAERCSIKIRVLNPRIRGHRQTSTTYVLRMRAVDDMIYYVGSLLRDEEGRGSPQRMSSPITIRPPGVYPINPRDPAQWATIEATAPLFRVTPTPRRRTPGYYSAEIEYRGARYASGPVNSRLCVRVHATDCPVEDGDLNDSSAVVLSLLSQLVIISQTAAAQNAPAPSVTTR